ncbi:MAG: DNA polymerase I [Clostridia bacterium]|nr:DNA polymerase I [Clostridia bacterium]
MEKLVLIDGNSLLNRAYYATPVFTTKDGLPTNGVFGFIKLMLRIIADKKPKYIVVAFDVHAPTFRHKVYDAYKAGRKPMPEDLAVQLPVLKEVLQKMNVKICELEGYEADDVIGTLSKKFDVHSYIYTGDRDSYQLVDEKTSVCFTRKGVSDLLELTDSNFKDETNLTPAQIIDLKALMGDKSDNIPGVEGIGEKSAYKLLEQFGTLDNIYANVDQIAGAVGRRLAENKANAYFSYELATINTNAPVDVELADCVLKMPFSASVRNRFAELEFKSIVSMNIFREEDKAENGVAALIEPPVREVIPSTIGEAIDYINASYAENIAVNWTDNEFRFFLKNKGDGKSAVIEQLEYVCPLKIGLLDVGFYDYQFQPLLKAVFEGKKRVISYYSKELRHKLAEQDIVFSAPFEDVSMLKCLSDGLANTDGLVFCLNYFALPAKNLAYGVYRLWEIYGGKLNEKEKWLYEKVELPLSLILFDMERRGISIDEKTLGELSDRYNKELKEVTEKIYELAGERFNINSTQKLGSILFEKLQIGAGVKKAKTTRSYKTTAEELEKYKGEHEIVRQILRYRQIQKINSTYVDGFKPLIKNGKVHTTYHQIKTETGRLSSANPNLQNIPVRTAEGRELRKLFVAGEGCVLLDADYSQIELRLLAHLSKCSKLIEAFRQNGDIHALTASQVMKTTLDKVTPEMRRSAKAVNFGIIYGMSGFGLGKDLGISTQKAQEYIDKYFENYPEVKEFMNKNVERAKEEGYTTTMFGRRRIIHELKSTNYNLRSFGERAAMNMPLQGTSADIIKIAMLGVYNKLKEGGYKAKLVLQVHDELVIDCPINEQEAVSKILQTEMENAVSLTVPLTAEVGIGQSWYSAK